MTRQFDPYTGKPTLAVQFMLAAIPAPKVERGADEVSTSFALAFIRDPAAGDVVVLRARHECYYTIDGKRVECLPFSCGAKPQPVDAYGRLDGTPAQMPRVECRGWGRAAIEYSAAFTRPAMHALTSASEFWMRLPTGEVGLNAMQIARLREFVDEVDQTPAHLGPNPVDLRK